ncbi:MAG: UDP-N-acetylglucosamine--N-acetylmuramyl-(pentapeptide) pyrophosphoryl-undecaprenol N-acetylglucosamine transferase [Candidatus Sericytochromatia bacterium]|nr:MAG: UDP-N-acetylglucosamine--N-acetylmuramyl-(pentapeptide) pyrophosphoryl-undecaprenol N-acetylglucosamine transferase [Candidatus Sericytochromatia bacterium]
MKKIIFTGGGTAGHVIPNISIINELDRNKFQIFYIGSKKGIEKELILKENITYFEIFSGKLRRYFSIENFIDIFKVLLGIIQSFFIIRKIKPNLIFSKGGFVSVPVVISGFLNKIPIISHESDITPGLATKISSYFSTKILTSFPETINYLPKYKTEYVGNPIRKELLQDNIDNSFINFKENKPILLIFGGSLGSQFINKEIRKILDNLIKNFNIIHICGKGNIDKNLENIEGYKQFEYLEKEMFNALKISDIVISRAGANSIFEILALKKPNILIPLSKKASRGDQILNAKSFEKSGFSIVIEEEELNSELLLNKILELYDRRNEFIYKMNKSNYIDSNKKILDILNKYC